MNYTNEQQISQGESFQPVDKLNSTDDACEILDIGKTSLYKLLKEGKITAIKIGKLTRIPNSSIEAFINNSPLYKKEG